MELNNYTLALIIVGGFSFLQMLYGLIRRSKGLAFIGFVFALVCALCYVIIYFYPMDNDTDFATTVLGIMNSYAMLEAESGAE